MPWVVVLALCIEQTVAQAVCVDSLDCILTVCDPRELLLLCEYLLTRTRGSTAFMMGEH